MFQALGWVWKVDKDGQHFRKFTLWSGRHNAQVAKYLNRKTVDGEIKQAKFKRV